MAGRKGIKEAKYTPRVQIAGVLRVLCPFCGTIGQHRLIVGQQWKIRCRNDECQRELGIGVRLLVCSNARSAAGVPRIPPDYVFPTAELDRWSPGEPAHELVSVDT